MPREGQDIIEQASDTLSHEEDGGGEYKVKDNVTATTEQSTLFAKKTKKAPLKALDKKSVLKYNEALRKRGVVYLSRIPPFMKPAKVKHLMEQHGKISRVYLVEEDQSTRRARKKNGGNAAKRYTEGWVEFEDKKIAKESLNNTMIGGRKRSYYHDDMWNIKYLKRFKWDHLTEKVAYERRVREQKLRLETMQAKRENAQYVELVESGRSLVKMEERKRKRREEQAAQQGEAGSSGGGGDEEFQQRVRRRFKQSHAVQDVGGGKGGSLDSTVLKSVFGVKGK